MVVLLLSLLYAHIIHPRLRRIKNKPLTQHLRFRIFDVHTAEA